MDTLLSIAAFTLGTVVGSFLNVVILRHHSGLGIGGRSGCMQCGTTLRWYNLVPLVSWIIQGGRCATCRSRILIQYPLVELVTGLLFLGAWSTVGFQPELVLLFVQFALLIALFVYDLRHKIIPDEFSFGLAGVSLIGIGYEYLTTSSLSLLALAAGPILATPFVLLVAVSHGRWMGLGDAKLALGIGWMLGLLEGYFAIAIGFWVGALVGVGLMVAGRITRLSHWAPRVTMTSEVPFGPFLVMGTIVMQLWGPAVLQVLGFYV